MDLPSAGGHAGGTTAGQVIAQPKVTPPPRGHKSRPTHTSRTILHIFFWFLACAVCHFDYRIATPGAVVRNTKERQKHCGTNFEYAFANESKEILKSNKTDAQKTALYDLCMYTQLTTTYCSKSPQELAPQQPTPQEVNEPMVDVPEGADACLRGRGGTCHFNREPGKEKQGR